MTETVAAAPRALTVVAVHGNGGGAHRFERMLPFTGGDVRFEAVSLPGLPKPREPFRGHADLEAVWDGEVIEVVRLDGSVGRVTVGGGGTVGCTGAVEAWARGAKPELGPLDLRVVLDAGELSGWRQWMPDLRRLEGRARVEAALTGPVADPDLGGFVVVEDFEARYGDLPAVDALSLRLRLVDDRLVLEDCGGEVGGAPFTVTGAIDDVRGERRFDLRLAGSDLLLFRSDSARFRADPDLTIRGPLASLRVAGGLELTEGRYLQDVPLLDLGQALRRAGRIGSIGGAGEQETKVEAVQSRQPTSLKLFSLRGDVLSNLAFDVTVTARDPVVLIGNLYEGSIWPDLRLRGTGEVPYLVGAVFLDRFRLSLPATTLRAESGLIRFDEARPLFPELAISATTRMRGLDITVAVTGPFNEPTVAISSSPPIPADELLLLVTTGRPPSEEGSYDRRSALITVARFLGADLLRQLFGGTRLDSSETLIDRFEFEAGRNLSRTGQETFEARFRLADAVVAERDSLYLTGERDDFDHYNMGLRIVVYGR